MKSKAPRAERLKAGPFKWVLLSRIVYYSKRFGKTITIPAGYPSDGATCAIDIPHSESWWVHDMLCDTCKWDDGSPCTNWQASSVLYDILVEEGHWIRAPFWRVATYWWGELEIWRGKRKW